MGSVVKSKKRNDGLYKTSVVVGRNKDGSYKRKYLYAKTKKELDEKRTELEHNLKYGLSCDNEKATFDEIAREWLAHKKYFVGESRFRRYEAVLRTHLDEIQRMPVIKLKTIHLQKIIDEKAALGYSTKVLAEIKQTAKQVLDYAMEYDILFRNVFYLVKIPKAKAGKRDALTDEQLKMVITYWQGHRMGIPTLIMLYCGLRRGEMIALQWPDIDLSKKVIRVGKAAAGVDNQFKIKGPKTDAGNRMVPIPDFLVDILKETGRKTSLFVCPSAKGAMMTGQAWKSAWDSYMHYLNICAGGRDASRSRPKIVAMEPFTAHQLRHSYSSLLYNADVDIKTAQQNLGHASIQTTLEIYTHLSKQKQEKSVKGFNDYLTENNITAVV